MNIKLNGEQVTVSDNATVADIVKTANNTHGSVAVAVDDMFVPRGKWDSTILADGSDVVLIGAAYGG